MALKRSASWVFAVVGGICLGAAAVGLSQQESTRPLAVAPARSPQDLSLAFREVANRVLPAVVSITTETRPREVANGSDGMSPLEERFFRDFFGNDPRFDDMFRNPGRSLPRQGSGSGFIVDPEGIVLTNSHVVENADRVTVRLQDGREIAAKSWDYDPRSDVGVVRLDVSEPLPFMALGDSDDMQVGDWVLALGNPFNVGTTVTAGIISATGRGPGINEREEYLQTDAAINPGNSGGPLVNLHGDVVGINTAISTRSGGYDGIGFAIPAKMVRWVADQLIANGKVERSYLGVALQLISNDIREQLGLDRGEGALVSEVMPDTPAEKAGFEPLDVVLEFDGKRIADRDELIDAVERSAPNQSYDVVVLRDGKRKTLSVRLEPMPQDYTPAMRRVRPRDSESEAPEEEMEVAKLGIEIMEITSEVASQLGLDDGTKGLVVRSVKSGSPAQRAGLRSGDVIQRVGSKPVNKLSEFRDEIQKANLERGILLHVKRGTGSSFVVLKPVD